MIVWRVGCGIKTVLFKYCVQCLFVVEIKRDDKILLHSGRLPDQVPFFSHFLVLSPIITYSFSHSYMTSVPPNLLSCPPSTKTPPAGTPGYPQEPHTLSSKTKSKYLIQIIQHILPAPNSPNPEVMFNTINNANIPTHIIQ